MHVDGVGGLCSNLRVIRGRILAIDFGTKNVGLACCEASGIAVRPLASIPNNGRKDLMKRLRAAMEHLEIDHVVVGLPWNMDGSAGEAIHRVERFMEAIRAELSIPVSGFDERLSTHEALELWRGMNTRQRRKYRSVDSLAAALILKRHLEES